MQDTMWATGQLLVTPDASMLKCYSYPVAQQCTCQLQEALLALQARTKNTGHHLPEIKENRGYNLRALEQGIIFINKPTITRRLSLSPARLLCNYLRAEEGTHQFCLLWAICGPLRRSRSHPSRAKVKNDWSYNNTSFFALMICTSTTLPHTKNYSYAQHTTNALYGS